MVLENPYSYLGRPVRTYRDFHGRRAELAKLTGDVRNGQCVSVVGPRRIGKTSLLLQLIDPEARKIYSLGDEHLTLYVSCDRLANLTEGEVYQVILRRMRREISTDTPGGLGGGGQRAGYSDFEDALDCLRVDGTRLTLLLDEFERLAANPALSVDFFMGLRALHTEYEMTFVTASVHPIMELPFTESETLASPFPNIFDSIRLGLFNEVEAREVTRKAGIFTLEVENYLLDLSGGHPLALQHACRLAFDRAQELDWPLGADDLNDLPEKLQDVMQDQYRYYWKRLSNEQKRVLSAPVYFSRRSKDDTPTRNLFKDLAALGLLTANPLGDYDYAGRALADFIRAEAAREQAAPVYPVIDLVGQALGQYLVQERLGRGGMADVYRAHQPSLNRDVAIKVMHPHIAANEGFAARFQREARNIAALRHPHIVQVFDFGEVSGIHYMVMEYIEGRNLETSLRMFHAREERMPLAMVQTIIDQVGGAVQYAHEAGMVHRDIKPSNVLLSERSGAVLTDFGLARIVEHTPYSGSTTIGTPTYMAPEQFGGVAGGVSGAARVLIDHRSDIYSLGIMMYEMCAGRPPFEGDTPAAVLYQHLQAPLPNLRSLRPEIPEMFVRVIEKATAKHPEDRYAGVGEMLEALKG